MGKKVGQGVAPRDLFEQLAGAFNDRDLERLAEISHPEDFEFTSHFVGVEGKPYTDWAAYFRDIDASLDDFRIRVDEVIPNADQSEAAVIWAAGAPARRAVPPSIRSFTTHGRSGTAGSQEDSRALT